MASKRNREVQGVVPALHELESVADRDNDSLKVQVATLLATAHDRECPVSWQCCLLMFLGATLFHCAASAMCTRKYTELLKCTELARGLH